MRKFIIIATILVIMVSAVYIALDNTYVRVDQVGTHYEYTHDDRTPVIEYQVAVAEDKLGNLDTIYFDTDEELFNFVDNVCGWN